MDQALTSILCDQDFWYYDPLGAAQYITFHRDGSGELWFMHDHTYLLAVDLSWESLGGSEQTSTTHDNAASASVVSTVGNSNDKTPQHLGQLHLQITLRPTLPHSFQGTPQQHATFSLQNAQNLSPKAYQPKKFHLALEKGAFLPAPHRATASSSPSSAPSSPQYGLRLRFITPSSPYPPRQDWATLDRGLWAEQYTLHATEFVARKLAPAECMAVPTNAAPSQGWGAKCAVC